MINLRELFLHLQTQLAGRLETARQMIGHPTYKGSASESGWIEMLGEYVPKRYCVTQAFAIDSDGQQSEQIDIVIYDRQYSPFLFHQDGATYIPAESVYAVLEVKQDLSKDHVEQAIAKAASVRRLHRTSARIAHAGGYYDPKPPIPILAGLVCLDSRWSPAFADPLEKALAAAPQEGRLDLLCSLKHGACEVTYPKEGPLTLDCSAPDAALIFFFLRLLGRLQEVGTVSAIDLSKYSQVLQQPVS
jgi:hypothetical protein